MSTIKVAQTNVSNARAEVATARNEMAAAAGDAAKATANKKLTEKQDDLRSKKTVLNREWSRKAFYWSTGIISVAGIAAVVVGVVGALKHVRTCTKTTERINGVPKVVTVCHSPLHVEQTIGQFALAWAGPVTAGVLILVACITVGRDNGGLVGFVIGKDNRLSTSKLQIVLWTIAVVFAFFFFLFQILKGASGSAFNSLDPAYLLLLGGPFAAAVLAKATTSSKTNDGTVQQVPASNPTVADVVEDHSGRPAIADTQFLLFNLVALTYFAFALAKNPAALPTIPSTLVGLTSVSALTYLGNKVVSSNQPTISSVSIVSGSADGSLKAGTVIRIIGANFTPYENQPETPAVVLFNKLEVAPTKLTNTEIEAKTPAGLASGTVKISVRTTAGTVTNAETASES